MCQVPVARLRTAVTDAMEPHGNMACWYISGCEFSGLKITLEEPLTYISPKKGYFFVGRGKVQHLAINLKSDGLVLERGSKAAPRQAIWSTPCKVTFPTWDTAEFTRLGL